MVVQRSHYYPWLALQLSARSAAGPSAACLGPPLLNILCARHSALTSTPGPGLRAHKEIACKLSEKFHHTEHRAAWPRPAAPQFGEDFFRSPITSKFASMTSKAHWQHESDLLHSGYIHVFMCRCEHSIISVLTKVAESHDRVTLLQHCCLQTFNSPHSWHRCLL